MPIMSDQADKAPIPSKDAQASQLVASLPFLRRYARAMTGSQSAGDALVRETLEAALRDPQTLAQIVENALGPYRALTMLWNGQSVKMGSTLSTDTHNSNSQLGRVSSRARQALLLNQLEDFSLVETAQILGVDEAEARELVDEALDDIARDGVAEVLIIEDEPLIAGHLDIIVNGAGHRVVATAATADQARAAFDRHRPTLILADVQLADGSSGIDAVEDILRLGPVPVIFITAFPEKLLTGEKPEPAFMITKPFGEQTVLTTISQALFFGSNLGR